MTKFYVLTGRDAGLFCGDDFKGFRDGIRRHHVCTGEMAFDVPAHVYDENGLEFNGEKLWARVAVVLVPWDSVLEILQMFTDMGVYNTGSPDVSICVFMEDGTCPKPLNPGWFMYGGK